MTDNLIREFFLGKMCGRVESYELHNTPWHKIPGQPVLFHFQIYVWEKPWIMDFI